VAPTIRLREGVGEQLQELFGCPTDGAVADVIGIDPSQFSRVSKRRSSPGPNFTARLLIAARERGLTNEQILGLFEVADEMDGESLFDLLDGDCAPLLKKAS
jgi:hypothetical protein